MFHQRIFGLLAFQMLLGVSVSYADVMTVPPGLDPGDEYRLVFITKDKIFTATSPSIGDYDSWVTSQADTQAALVALGTTWRVIGSTTSVSAKFHTDTDDSPAGPNGVPIYRLDGVRIADNYDDLWDGSIQSPLYVAQDGSVLDTCCGTWTGTSTAGLAVPGSELGATDLGVTDGAPNGTAANWIETAQFGANSQQFLYAISDVLRVPGGAIDVSIDIKPGNKRNKVNPDAKGKVWVAVLSDTDTPFDALQIDIPTVRFGSGGAEVNRHKVKDVNKDGLPDLMLRFNIRKTGIECGDTEATLTGETFEGLNVTGTDFIKTVRCKIKTYEIGDTGPAGGIVFYITDGGLHGIEAAPVDQAIPFAPGVEWGCFGDALTGADGTAIGTGQQNTADILALAPSGCNTRPIAASVAADYAGPDGNSLGEWFLPSKDELNELYLNRGVVGGFATSDYWSSSEIGFEAWYQYFGDGGVSGGAKWRTSGVRAVRAF